MCLNFSEAQRAEKATLGAGGDDDDGEEDEEDEEDDDEEEAPVTVPSALAALTAHSRR